MPTIEERKQQAHIQAQRSVQQQEQQQTQQSMQARAEVDQARAQYLANHYLAKADALWPKVKEASSKLNRSTGTSFETWLSAMYEIWDSIELDTKHRTYINAADMMSGKHTGHRIAAFKRNWDENLHPKHWPGAVQKLAKHMKNKPEEIKVVYAIDLSDNHSLDTYFSTSDIGRADELDRDQRLVVEFYLRGIMADKLRGRGYVVEGTNPIVDADGNRISEQDFHAIATELHQEIRAGNYNLLEEVKEQYDGLSVCDEDISVRFDADAAATPRGPGASP